MNKLVLFHSSGCLPCEEWMKLIPLFEEQNFNIEKVSIDTERGFNHAKRYRIFSTPTVLFVKQDIIVGMLGGYGMEATLEQNFQLFMDKAKDAFQL